MLNSSFYKRSAGLAALSAFFFWFASASAAEFTEMGGKKITNSLGMEFVYIKPGSFMMGSPSSEPGHSIYERQHKVTLIKGFYMQTTEVTIGQWRRFVNDTGYRSEAETQGWAGIVIGKEWEKRKGYYWAKTGFSQNDNQPVTCVTWNDVQAYIGWLSRKEGKDYKLPTEAEWECAARAGSTTAFANGGISELKCGYDSNLDAIGWYCGNSNDSTHPVAQKQPNYWGLYDMHGNVMEWCQDRYQNNPSGAVIDPTGHPSGAGRVRRGGGWTSPAGACRSAFRYWRRSDSRDNDLGFRIALKKAAGPKKALKITDTTPSKPASESAGKFTNSLGMEFFYIKQGTFMMGSPSSEPGRSSNEQQHKVTLTKGFYMQSTEVNQGQWMTVMGYNPSHFRNCGDTCPVEKVSWNDVQDFIRRLNQKVGSSKYRLPTEAEWEYACRAGTGTAFANGGISELKCGHDSNLDAMGWYCGNSNNRTHPVAQQQPNNWGLYDMHGNVMEWCQDWFQDTYPSGSAIDPTGPSSGSHRVFRGDSWGSEAMDCRSASRNGAVYDGRVKYLGFRLALSPGQ